MGLRRWSPAASVRGPPIARRIPMNLLRLFRTWRPARTDGSRPDAARSSRTSRGDSSSAVSGQPHRRHGGRRPGSPRGRRLHTGKHLDTAMIQGNHIGTAMIIRATRWSGRRMAAMVQGAHIGTAIVRAPKSVLDDSAPIGTNVATTSGHAEPLGLYDLDDTCSSRVGESTERKAPAVVAGDPTMRMDSARRPNPRPAGPDSRAGRSGAKFLPSEDAF